MTNNPTYLPLIEDPAEQLKSWYPDKSDREILQLIASYQQRFEHLPVGAIYSMASCLVSMNHSIANCEFSYDEAMDALRHDSIVNGYAQYLNDWNEIMCTAYFQFFRLGCERMLLANMEFQETQDRSGV